jgi:hypothetical protein
MEDKWFIYEDRLTLHVHRSWTGQLIYVVDFSHESDGVRVRRARVSAVAAQGIYDAKLLRYLLRGLVLGQAIPFPIPTGGRSADGLIQHIMVGRGGPEERVASRAPLRAIPWKVAFFIRQSTRLSTRFRRPGRGS